MHHAKVCAAAFRVYSHNLQSRINVRIKKIITFYVRFIGYSFIREMRLDNSLYAYAYAAMQVVWI